MTMTIILNAIFGGAVVTGAVAPLVWAIRTQHHHQPVVVATARRTGRARAHVARDTRRRLSDPIVWPAA